MSVYTEKEIDQMKLSHEIIRNTVFIKFMFKAIYLGTCIICIIVPLQIIFG